MDASPKWNQPATGSDPRSPQIAYVYWKTLSHSSKPQSLFCKESFSHSKNLVSPCPGTFTELKTPLNISPLKMAELWRIGVVYEVKTNQWQLLMENQSN